LCVNEVFRDDLAVERRQLSMPENALGHGSIVRRVGRRVGVG
jgi:hypothetical protein